jgi:NADH-quinone oxidoreductase subunit J
MSALTFYLLSAAAVFSTLMAISRRELIHAVVYLVLSFFSLGLIFFMMGAPLIAALEVLIYAGAIMVLFLFIVMMLEMGAANIKLTPFWRVWGPAVFIALIILVSMSLLFFGSPETAASPPAAFISPRQFGHALYTKYMLAVEAASLLLLFALVGALYLGKKDNGS